MCFHLNSAMKRVPSKTVFNVIPPPCKWSASRNILSKCMAEDFKRMFLRLDNFALVYVSKFKLL